MIEAVIFDVDGTLINSVDQHAKAWLWAFARHGHDIPFEDIRAQIGKGGDQLMPVFLPPDELAHIGETLADERGAFFKDEYLPHLHAFPMVRELFERIRADGKRIALASSAKPDELERYEQIAEIADLVEHSTSSDDAEKSKPHPDIFHAALAKLGNLDPSRAIVVGDSPWDAIAAAKAGLKTIGVLCGGFAKLDLKDAGCVAIYTNPAELLLGYDESPLAGKAPAG
jgi:HAD superfamily hydrolase (TIGR01509 family)